MVGARAGLGVLAASIAVAFAVAAVGDVVEGAGAPFGVPMQTAAAWDAAVAVPTLGEWGVVFLALSIITTAWLMARRSRTSQSRRR